MYVCLTVYASVYICLHGFIFSKNYALFFFNLLNEHFKQCTKVKHSNVYTSAFTFLQSILKLFTLLNLQCLLDL